MTIKESYYENLINIISYPTSETVSYTKKFMDDIKNEYPGIYDRILPFESYLKTKTREELEEQYTAVFDVQAICPLDLGYVLFGEDYKRGEFLVQMSALHREYQSLKNESELADYLPNVLNLLKKMPENQMKKDLVEKLILPALKRMIATFDKANPSPYSLPIRALDDLFDKNYKMNSKILEVRYE